MKITRERKIIGSILVLAAGAFGFDRIHPANDMEAPPADSLLIADANSAHKSGANSSAGFDEQSLAERLAQQASAVQTADAKPMRDVFMQTKNWGDASASAAELSDNSRAQVLRHFTQAHHLTAVLNNAQGGAAIIDSKLLHVGGMLDGFKLIALSHQSATFDAGDGNTMELRVNGQVASGQ